MVLIPAGEFEMGDLNDVGEYDEKPVHPVYLDEFYIDKYEVTVGRYREFIEATGRLSANRGGSNTIVGHINATAALAWAKTIQDFRTATGYRRS